MDLLIKPRLVRVVFPQSRRVVLPRVGALEIPEFRDFVTDLLRAQRRGRFRAYGADLSITATTVVIGTGATLASQLLCGETLTAGQVLYQKAADLKYYKASNSVSGLAEVYTVAGIALNGGNAGQSLQIQTGGIITIGATVTLALEYYLSANAGGICPIADVASGKRAVRLGFADSVTTLTFDLRDMGTKP